MSGNASPKSRCSSSIDETLIIPCENIVCWVATITGNLILFPTCIEAIQDPLIPLCELLDRDPSIPEMSYRVSRDPSGRAREQHKLQRLSVLSQNSPHRRDEW